MPTPLLLGLALAAAAPAPKGPPAQPPGLDGEWAVESSLKGGLPDGALEKKPIDKVVIGGGRWRVVRGAEGGPGTEIQVDPTKSPAEITFRDEGGGAADSPGIYKVDGDRLTVCYTIQGERPTAFESPAGSGVRLLTLRRIRPKD